MDIYLMRVIYFVNCYLWYLYPNSRSLSDKELLKLLYKNLFQRLAHFACNAREHTSTDLKETEVYERF